MMKQKDIVFVGGIHGVGKSTLCSKFNNLLGISHYSASDLIKKKNRELVNTSKTRMFNILCQVIKYPTPYLGGLQNK